MVGADTFRAGAKEQLKQNALRCNIPYYIDFSTVDPVKVAYDGVNQFKKEKYEIIIVDTSGKHKQENELFKEMQQIVEVIVRFKNTKILSLKLIICRNQI